MKKAQGFSLIELLIVVAIIGIVAAIAIPNLLQARKTANEASAIGALRTIAGAQVTYHSNNQTYTNLAGLLGANLIDTTIANSSVSNPKSGYWCVCGPPVSTEFQCNNNPASPGGSGDRYFGVTESGVIHFNSVALMRVSAGGPLQGTPLGNAAAS